MPITGAAEEEMEVIEALSTSDVIYQPLVLDPAVHPEYPLGQPSAISQPIELAVPGTMPFLSILPQQSPLLLPAPGLVRVIVEPPSASGPTPPEHLPRLHPGTATAAALPQFPVIFPSTAILSVPPTNTAATLPPGTAEQVTPSPSTRPTTTVPTQFSLPPSSTTPPSTVNSVPEARYSAAYPDLKSTNNRRPPPSIISPTQIQKPSTERPNRAPASATKNSESLPAKPKSLIHRVRDSITKKRNPRQEPSSTQDPNKIVSLFAFHVPKSYAISRTIHAIILLYYSREARDKKKHMEITAGTVITDSVAVHIRTYMSDAVVYGKAWEEDVSQSASDLFENFYVSKNYIFMPHRHNEKPDSPADWKSVSRCDNRGDGFTPEGFKYSPQTFGELNVCEERVPFIFPDYSSVFHPYSFRGVSLSKYMKKMIVNIKTAFDSLRESSSFSKLSASKKTALVTNIQYYTVLRLVKLHEEGGTFEETERKPYVSQLQKKLEKIDLRAIDRIIKSYYAKNVSPLLNDIYSEFISTVREEELKAAEEMGPVSGDDEESLPPLFSCSKETFRQLLHKLGYVYGKLDTRAVILKDERIVRLRHKYLTRIRQNDALGEDKKRPVIFLDETW